MYDESFPSDLVLYHYGVKGMKWGIRRSAKQLGKKIESLQKKNKKLPDKISKYKTKAASKERLAAYYGYKAIKKEARRGMHAGQKYRSKQAKYTLSAADYNKRAAKAEAKLMKNEKVLKSFTRTLDEMNAGTLQRGESFFENFFMRYYDE